MSEGYIPNPVTFFPTHSNSGERLPGDFRPLPIAEPIKEPDADPKDSSAPESVEPSPNDSTEQKTPIHPSGQPAPVTPVPVAKVTPVSPQ